MSADARPRSASSLAPPRSSARRSWPWRGEQAQVQLAFGGQAGAVAVAAEGLRHAGDDADLAAAVARSASARRSRRRRWRRAAPSGNAAPMPLDHLGRRQHFVHAPAVAGADVHVLDEAQHDAAECSRKWRAIGTISWSLVPRLTTMLTLIGARPGARAASMPASTSATGKSTSFMRRKTASSSASRLTVTRCRPASFSACALRRQQRAVGGQRQVERLAVGVRSCGQHGRPAARGACAAAARRRSGGSCARRGRRRRAPGA